MFQVLEKITEQVTRYSTFFGQLWYILVFVFRLIVVITLGGAVYGDEQSNFVCVTKDPGCDNVCFDQFVKVSHLRFWGFQLLAVACPAVFFHFFSLYMTSQIGKWENLKKSVEGGNQDDSKAVTDVQETNGYEENAKNMAKKKRVVGKVKTKHVYSDGEVKEVKVNNKIYIAYYICTLLKLTMEAIFIFFTYELFYIPDLRCKNPQALPHEVSIPKCDYSFVDRILLNEVPHTYNCLDDFGSFRSGCPSAAQAGWDRAVVKCFTSRPYEKTIFIRYMNILAFVCLILCAIELLYMPIRLLVHMAKRSRKRAPPRAVYIYRNGPAPEMNWNPETASTAGESTANRRSIAYTESKS